MWFIIGLLLGFVLGFFVYGVRYYLKQSKMFLTLMKLKPDLMTDIKDKLDKKHMEEKLRLKLELDENIKKINDETFKKLQNIKKKVDNVKK